VRGPRQARGSGRPARKADSSSSFILSMWPAAG
jgi:hypothetical protein